MKKALLVVMLSALSVFSFAPETVGGGKRIESRSNLLGCRRVS